MNLSKNFTLEEMVASNTASLLKIDNTPSKAELDNLKKLCNEILQPIRDKFGKPIKVTSGYRCLKLNTKIGGAKSSDHMVGAAADIKPASGSTKKLWDVIYNMVKNGEITCRQLIWEYGTKSAPQWIHIAINNPQHGYKKNQILYLYNK